jgi:hypothetical protein
MNTDNDDRTWRDQGWTAQIVVNEDGGGWALEMTPDSQDEPLLTAPWVMGRNKKDPKPLNAADFATQVKAAQDFLTRREQQILRAYRVTRDVTDADGARVRVVFDVVPDEFEPEGVLVARDIHDQELGRVSCAAGFQLTPAAAQAWVDGGYEAVSGGEDDGW